jgi:hypothetical protein
MLASGAHAFLRTYGARVIALFEAQEHVFKLVHAGIGEQQSRVVLGNQTGKGHIAVTVFCEVFDKFSSDLVTFHSKPA